MCSELALILTLRHNKVQSYLQLTGKLNLHYCLACMLQCLVHFCFLKELQANVLNKT